MGPSFPLGKIAVYIHIPFCLSRCGYCSFYSVPYSRKRLESYVEALKTEIRLFEERCGIAKLQARTLYFGGGTPSLLEAGTIGELCGMFGLDKEAEITLEINPIQITDAYTRALAKTPVNRLSIGLQSTGKEELGYLRNRRGSEKATRMMQVCREHGFTNISLDLMYGIPGMTLMSLGRVLDDYIALGAEHLSCYLLSLDEDCRWAREEGAKAVEALPDEDSAAGQYELIRRKLARAGYIHYEISNFAKAGRQSRHNLCYWNSDPYLAIGASASGWLPPRRYTNQADIAAWQQMLASGEIMPQSEICDAAQSERDYIMMRLRLLEGLDNNEFRCRFGREFAQGREKAIAQLTGIGMLESDATSVRLTPQALFVSNAVIGELT